MKNYLPRAFGPDGKIWLAGLILSLAFLAVCFYRGLHVPWVENDNYYGAIYAQAAHNNLRAGVLATGGIPATLYFGPLPIPIDAYYVHHPTLLPLAVTASFAVFGEAEWSARLVPIVCSLLSVIFLWIFLSEAVNRRAAALAVAMLVTLPMELHYGDMVDFEPCLVMLMLAALVCLQRWLAQNHAPWAWLSVACCFLAVWMDWPGYLFVISLIVWFLWKEKKSERLFALVLMGICGVSGVFFLFQIRHVNPDAWSDLWTALKMRLGNGTATGSSAIEMKSDVHFTFAEWCVAVGRAFYNDYTPPPLILAAAGGICVLRGWKKSESLRRAGWGALHMTVAGVLYVVILRNESFIHDFTTFYLVAVVAMLAALSLECMLRWIENNHTDRWLRPAIALAILTPCVFAVRGYRQAEQLRSPFYMLDGITVEPPDLIPKLGAHLAKTFSEETTILCNFDPYGSVLPYYAQRMILNNLADADDWKTVQSRETGPFGGIVWLDAPGASDIVASLPKNEITPFEMGGFHFAIWRGRAPR